MRFSMTVLIPKQTAALTVTKNIGKSSVPCTLAVDGDMAANSIAINQIGINGTDATVAADSAGTALVLTATKTSIVILAPCITTNAVGVIVVS
jgi:hypothetical protein